ncbi:MAG TPA: hypothetical protein PLH53_13475 [Ignavibacteriaceae bacterium]|nr:hypothetical protein [Ignavibacteriaceae bacterium]
MINTCKIIIKEDGLLIVRGTILKNAGRYLASTQPILKNEGRILIIVDVIFKIWMGSVNNSV